MRDAIEALRRVPGTADPLHRLEHSLAELGLLGRNSADEIRADFHRIVYAKSEVKAREAYAAFERKWSKLCPGVVTSLREGGEELFTFFSFPKAQWKTLRTTNVIERLNEEFRRRVKTQCSFPSEDSATALLFALVASGRIKLRRIDGWKKLADVIALNQRAEKRGTGETRAVA